jgi:hypothetical protein
MEPIAISAHECIEALRLAGFRVTRRLPGCTALARRGKVVIVPDVLTLPPSLFDAILDEADLSYVRFLELLDEAPTEPDINPPRAS